MATKAEKSKASAIQQASIKGMQVGSTAGPTKGRVAGATVRTRRGKVTSVGGHRVVKYFELTPHELEKVQDDRDEGSVFFALSALFLGIAIDSARDLFMSKNISSSNFEIVATVLLIFGALAILSAAWGYAKRRRATTYLQSIKDDHDFPE
ncbi:MAG: hypothetical protein WBA51_03745 [Erythrobacter sp.]